MQHALDRAVPVEIIEVSTLDDVREQADRIRELVRATRVCLLRGLVDPAQVRASLARLQLAFSAENDTKIDHKSHVDRAADVPNYQRLMLGEWGETATAHAFFMRAFYNPMWNEDLWQMRETFRAMTIVRNLLYDVREDYCLDGPEDAFYTLSRIHHYPAGGGFLKSHIDSVASQTADGAGLNGFIQILLAMSCKGTDFQQGGGYFVQAGRRVYYEDFTVPGDLLVYNGRTMHGVGAVDPQAPTDLTSIEGRFSAMVTLYRSNGG